MTLAPAALAPSTRSALVDELHTINARVTAERRVRNRAELARWNQISFELGLKSGKELVGQAYLRGMDMQARYTHINTQPGRPYQYNPYAVHSFARELHADIRNATRAELLTL